MVRRILAVLALSTLLVGLGAVPAAASYEICPYVKLWGRRYEVCIPVP